jgi:hypothetical protein
MKRTIRGAFLGALVGMLTSVSSLALANECLVTVFTYGSQVAGLHSIDVSPGYTTWTYEGELYRAGVLMDEDDTASPDQSVLWTYAPLTYCAVGRVGGGRRFRLNLPCALHGARSG